MSTSARGYFRHYRRMAGAGKPPPSGVATFLFTDIEGSTWLVQHLGDDWPRVLHDHYRLLRQVWDEHGGYEVSTEGDAFFVAFVDARDAVGAAVDAQRRLAEHPWPIETGLRVRIGLHTGEARLYDDDYVGLAVHQAARVKSAAHGGQIVVTQATREAAGDDFAYRELGLHRLKDLAQPVRICQVDDPSLPPDFPPPKTLSVMPNNFPIQSSTFVGREDDVATLTRTVATFRVVTLTGAGGVGKTRLALQVGAELIDDFPDGVWLVDLARLADPDAVVLEVADTLSIGEQPGRDVAATIVDYLRSKQLLIVMDNCEHLIDACAEIVHAIVTTCADVKVLATSRESLNVTGEQSYRLRSLGVPPIQADDDLESIARTESVRLFCQRAQAADPGFELSVENAEPIVQICRRLDGLALAIELAAARCRSMSPRDVAARLDDRFRLLTGGVRMTLPRQRTLEATVAWSYELLSGDARLLFERLSVFAGGCTLDAGERVCGVDGLDARDVVDLLHQLVNRSLVIADEGLGGRTRYRLLETLRQFGRERLLERGELATARDRHLAWVGELAPTLPAQTGTTLPPEIEEDDANIRAAIEWAIERQDFQAGLRVIADIWTVSGHLRDRERWYTELLTGADQAPPDVAARALSGAGGMSFMLGDWATADARFERAADAARRAGDDATLAMALLYGAGCQWGMGDDAGAIARLEEGLAIATATHNGEMVRRGLIFSAWLTSELDLDVALARAREVDELSRVEGTLFDRAHAREVLGLVYTLQGDARSAATVAEALPLMSQLLAGCGAHALETAAVWATIHGRHELGAEFLGSAERVREETGDTPRPWERSVHTVWLPQIAAALDDETYIAAKARGTRRSREEALAFAAREIAGAASGI
ncbi:MAG: adenylate/guanylate cyclase domain-containing protein [Actinomycetota bacterium]